MNLRKRQIRAARKAKAQRLQRWNGVPVKDSKWKIEDAPSGHSARLKRLSGGRRAP